MSTATRVPETSSMRGGELSADDASTTLRRYRIPRLMVNSFVRFRYGDGFTHARALGLQLCLAIIPLAIATVGLAGSLHQAKLARLLTGTVQHLTPGQGKGPVNQALEQASQGSALALVFGLLAGLVSLTTAMGQVERGANRVYGVERDHPSKQKYVRAAVLAVTAGLAALLGFVIIVGGGAISDALSDTYGASGGLHGAWSALRWPLGILLTLVAITALLKYAPRRRQPGYSWLAVGAAVGLILWLIFSVLLGLYVSGSGGSGSIYGQLPGVFALLVWANLTSLALFLGIAFAAQLEAVRAGVPQPAHVDPELVSTAPR
jgi:YihY family inner membrane protein